MHRSGTSALARILGIGGADLGKDDSLSRAAADNESGFWEAAAIRDLNDTLLDRHGGTWSAPPMLPEGWEQNSDLDDLIETAGQILRELWPENKESGKKKTKGKNNAGAKRAKNDKGESLRLAKDPRLSLTLPFWQRVIPDLDTILCVRNPLEVASSLHARDILPIREGLELWTVYTLSSIVNANPTRTPIVFYDLLLADWAATYDEIRKRLGTKHLKTASAAQPQIDAFLDGHLRHHTQSIEDLESSPDARFTALALYRALRTEDIATQEGFEGLQRLARRGLNEHFDSGVRAMQAPVYPLESDAPESQQALAAPEAVEKIVTLQTLVSAERARARAEHSALSRELVSARAQRDSALLGAESIRTRLADAEGRAEALTAQLAQSDDGIRNQQGSLETKNAALTERIETERLRIASHKSQAEGLRSQLASRHEQVTRLRAQITSREAQVERLKTELASQSERTATLQSQSAKQDEQFNASQAQLASQAERIATLQQQLDTLAPEHARLTAQLLAEERTVERLEGDLLVSRNERDLAESSRMDLLAQHESMLSDFESARADNMNLLQQIEEERQLVLDTEAQREALNERFNAAEQARLQLRSNLDAANLRITEMQTRHEEQIEGYRAQREKEQTQWRTLLEGEQARHLANTDEFIARISTEYEAQVETFRSSADILDYRVKELSETVKDRDGKIVAMQAVHKLKQHDYDVALQHVRDQHADLTQKLAESEQRGDHLETRVEHLCEKFESELHEGNRLRKRKSELARERNDSIVALRALQVDHARTLERFERLSQELAEAVSHRNSLRAVTKLALWLSARKALRFLPLPRFAKKGLKSVFFSVLSRLAPRSGRVLEYQQSREVEARRIAAPPVDASIFLDSAEAGPRPFDVIIFSVIDWHFRHQRPQHLALELARRGYRVFYLATTFESDVEDYWPEPEFVSPGVALLKLPCPLPQPVIYKDAPNKEQIDAISSGLDAIRKRFAISSTVSIVNHPFWTPIATAMPANRVAYDCMDHHAGFANTSSSVLDAEAELLRNASLVICTAKLLEERAEPIARRTVRVPNAGEFEHFSSGVRTDTRTRPVVGYFGAIAEWFDMELVARCAHAIPEADFILIGSTFGADLSAVEGIPNVEFSGEAPYAELPASLAGFDVCLIPFQVNDLTLSTNPVKVFEYLAAGKPVVSVRLPEVEPMEDVVALASTPDEFVEHVKAALDGNAPGSVESRRQFAEENSWQNRGVTLDTSLRELFPKVSIVVLTYNQLEFTKACLHSLDHLTEYPDWELIIVDNASSDDTPQYLEEFARTRPYATVILNDENLGFAGGNNVGAEVASGEFIVFLNNDTFVTAGWLSNLLQHFDDEPELGLLGPVTNNIGNEARIEIDYLDMTEMAQQAENRTRKLRHQRFDYRSAAFFCAAIPTRLWREIGGLDEGFEVGFFEDDDYSNRVRQAGYRVMCAEDVFIHHHLSASFDALGNERKQELFEKNLAHYESKWGTWVPHRYREPDTQEAPDQEKES